MEEEKYLARLAEIFAKYGFEVYAVGGYVRSKLLGVKNENTDDIDICSCVKIDKLKKMLDGTEFKMEIKNERLGVCNIISSEFKVEHATFRKEYYEVPGEHIPVNVEFTTDIIEDASRRDFTINSVYLNLRTGTYIDPFGGIKDLHDKKIRCVISPNFVLSNDGIRLLRMIRFAVVLGFEIDEETLSVARHNACRLNLVSKNLIRKEFDNILIADTYYPQLPRTRMAHFRGIRFIGELGLWKYIIPAMQELQDSGIKTIRAPETVYEHSLYSVSFAKPKYRLAVLLHDIGLLYIGDAQKNINMAEISGKAIPKILKESNLGYSAKYIEEIANVITLTGYDMLKKPSRVELRKFIIDNNNKLDDIINVKVPTLKAVSNQLDKSEITCTIQDELLNMRKLNLPISLNDLKITGDDIIAEFPYLPRKYISNTLNEVLYQVSLKGLKNNFDVEMNIVRKIVRKFA